MLSGSYGLVLNELNEEPFLERVRELAGADSAALFRWLKNDPQHEISTQIGDALVFPEDVKSSLHDVLHADSELPLAARDLAESAKLSSGTAQFLLDPRLLSIVLDTQPSRILIVLARRPSSPVWTDAERSSFLEVTRVMRQSVRLHKLVDSMSVVIESAREIFNSSPSGMLILQPNGVVNAVNRRARKILQLNDGIGLQDGRLLIDDRALRREFDGLLTAAITMDSAEARRFRWHRAIPRNQATTSYQLSMHVLNVREWNIESRDTDKVIVVYLADPAGLSAPTIEQLRRYYGFTDAQAKVALALWGGTGIGAAADNLHISVNTARTHLRSIYEKVGVANHAELMAVLTTSLNRSLADADEPDDSDLFPRPWMYNSSST